MGFVFYLKFSSLLLKAVYLSNVIAVASYFQNINTITSAFSHEGNCQADLAILDTKHVRQIPPSKLISAYNFATESPSSFSKKLQNFSSFLASQLPFLS